MSANGISAILMQLAASATEHTEQEKRSFVPMPGGEAAPPPVDPAMAGMDPAMMGGGGMPPGMDPMAMAAGGSDPAAIMAAQGMPVDPMMAMAGGAGAVPPPAEAAPPPAEAAPAEGAKGGKVDKLEEIHSMLTKVMGIMVGKGLLGPEEIGMGPQGEGQMALPPQEPGIPSEQKIAADTPESVGSVVDEVAGEITLTSEKKAVVKNALAGLILSLSGKPKT